MRLFKVHAIPQMLLLTLALPLAVMGKVPEGGKRSGEAVTPTVTPTITIAARLNASAAFRTERVVFTKRRKAVPVGGKVLLADGLEKGARLRKDGSLELGMTEYKGKLPPNSPKIEYCTPKRKVVLGNDPAPSSRAIYRDSICPENGPHGGKSCPERTLDPNRSSRC
jgi:hypothetical protein